MTELRINGHERVRSILIPLLPFLKFKKKQAEAIIDSANALLDPGVNEVVRKQRIIQNILLVQSENYATRAKRSRQELEQLIGLTPYRLNPKG